MSLISSKAETEQKRFLTLWHKAEDDIKLCERIASKLLIPAVNELRYAGTHHALALEAATEEAQLDQLSKAQKHCIRASYDAIEMVIIHELERVDQFRHDYRQVEITSAVPDYTALRGSLREVRALLERARQDDTREVYYERLRAQVQQVREIADRFDDAREELNKRVLSENRKARNQIVSVVVGVASIVVAVVLWALTK